MAPISRWYFQLLTAGNHFQRARLVPTLALAGVVKGSNAAIAIAPGMPELIAQKRRAPGHAATERLEQQQITALDAPVTHTNVQCQWHRGSRSVAVLLHRHNDSLHRHSQFFRDRL